MIKTDVSPDCCACLMLSWRENISDVGNEYPRTEHSSQFDLCLQGPTALALMNWRGGFCYPTPTTTASPYRVRRTASSVTFTLWTQCFFSHLLRAVVGLPSCSLSDTTREKRRQEKEGVDYHFVSVPMFEEDILNHRCALVVSFPMVLKIVPLFMRVKSSVSGDLHKTKNLNPCPFWYTRKGVENTASSHFCLSFPPL